MSTITIEEARARFGSLVEPMAKAHREFEAPEGIWRPEFEAKRVTGYRLHPTPPKIKIKRWYRPKQR
jgi:hypothetical protein